MMKRPMMNPSLTQTRQRQSGVGLIEVLVSMVLLAMGLLGAVALQVATAKEQRSAQFVSRAAIAANEIAERMRANRESIMTATGYVTPNTTYAAGIAAAPPPAFATAQATPRPMTVPSGKRPHKAICLAVKLRFF
jgi:type IV pilus modification protein PilV